MARKRARVSTVLIGPDATIWPVVVRQNANGRWVAEVDYQPVRREDPMTGKTTEASMPTSREAIDMAHAAIFGRDDYVLGKRSIGPRPMLRYW
jgi:hypothetical protein